VYQRQDREIRPLLATPGLRFAAEFA